MRHLDHDYVNEIMRRFESLPSGAKPVWGTMTPPELTRHLIFTVKYSMGQAGKSRVYGRWFVRRIIGPLILNGVLRIPRNARLPKPVLEVQKLQEYGDLETLHAVLETYLNLVQSGELVPEPHPVFGPIGVDGWDQMHVRHFEHHLRQFRV